MKRLAVLGSTGSIGRNTAQVVREMEGQVEIAALAAGGNVEELLKQTLEFRPGVVSMKDEESRDRYWKQFSELANLNGYRPEALWGSEGNLAVGTGSDIDIVMSAAVGVAGLEATYQAVCLGKRVALANKEVLVVAGELVMNTAKVSGTELLPVDSEHNAAHQCLSGGSRQEVSTLILTASGGPFRTVPKDELANVTPSQALNHPTWKMGSRITIDSATLMNKGFEVIEACHLFDFSAQQVDVVVHPQSIVHALVEFQDGSVIAQLAPADMKMPIRYALTYPERQVGPEDRKLRWDSVRQLEFEPPDYEKFPLLGLAYEVLNAGGAAGCVLNAADEVAVQAFLDGKIPFTTIADIAKSTLDQMPHRSATSVAEILEIDIEARSVAERFVGSKC